MAERQESRNQQLMRGTVIYAIGNFGSKILSFLIAPLYTYYINPTEMGQYDILNTTIGLLTPFLTLQIGDATYKWIITNRQKSKEYMSVAFQLLIATSFLSVIIITIVNHFVAIPYCSYFVVLLIIGRFADQMQRVLRALGKQKLFAILGILNTFVFLIVNVVQICLLNRGVEAILTSSIISNAVVIIIVSLCEPRVLPGKFLFKMNFPLQKQMIKFSAPMIPNIMNWWVINSSDRYIVNFFLGTAANGILSLSYKFPTLLQLVNSMFYNSLQDLAIGDKHTAEKDTYYTKIFETYYLFIFGMLIPLIPATRIVIEVLMEESYHSSALYTSWIYIGVAFQGLSSFLGIGYMKSGNTKEASKSSIYAAIINAISHILMIKFIGLHAAGISTMLGFAVMTFIRLRDAKLYLNITVNKIKFCSVIIGNIVVSVVTLINNLILQCFLVLVGMVIFILINRTLIVDVYKKAGGLYSNLRMRS
mgnify:CR=1 FL=1